MIGSRRLVGAVAAMLLGWACATGSTADDEVSSSNGVGGGPVGGAGGAPTSTMASSSTGNASVSSAGGGVGMCGDTMCEPPEDCTSCELDCGPCAPMCGDTMCELPETCVSCPGDCPGAADCDGNPSNGYECSTLGCCANACQTQHVNGLGQFFYDCVALGTHDLTQAFKAAAAWPMGGTTAQAGCTGPGQNEVVCKLTVSSCACWNYTGTNIGHVHLNGTSTTCNCPTSADPTWN